MTRVEELAGRVRAASRRWQARRQRHVRCGVCGEEGHNRNTCAQNKYVTGETLVDGEIHQVMHCGHTAPAELDRDGMWISARRRCPTCDEARKQRR